MIIVYWGGMQASLVSPVFKVTRVESQIMASDMDIPRALVGLSFWKLRTRQAALGSSGQVTNATLGHDEGAWGLAVG